MEKNRLGSAQLKGAGVACGGVWDTYIHLQSVLYSNVVLGPTKTSSKLSKGGGAARGERREKLALHGRMAADEMHGPGTARAADHYVHGRMVTFHS